MKVAMEIFTNTLLILLLPIMFYIQVFDGPVNISLGDFFFPLVGLFIVIKYKKIIKEKGWIYLLYFLCLILSLILSHVLIQKNESVISVSYMALFIEILKTVIVGGYFYIGYNFVKDTKRYKLVLYTLSIGGLPVGFIGLGAYVYYILGKSFFIESFNLQMPNRAIGTFQDPNLYAFYLIMIFYISILNSRIIRNKLASYGMILISIFSVILLIMTMSRSGWLAFIGSLMFFVIINFKKFTKRHITTSLIIVFLIFAGIQLDYSFQRGKIVNTMIDRIENLLIQGDEIDRFQLSKAALQMGNDHFLFGVGKGNFPLNSYKYLGRDNINYQLQLIPHNTIFGIYAQQGIIGLIIFLILPAYLIYKLIKTKGGQNKYIIPLLIGFFIQSFGINIENIRFLWFLFGILLASCDLDIKIELIQKTFWDYKKLKVINIILIVFIIGFMTNISRHFCVNILSYGDKEVEKTIKLPEKGVYLLSFDIHTNDKENRVEVYENDKLIKSFIFKSAYGKVEEFIYFDEEEIMIKFTGDKERWMKVLNIYITKDNLIIPVYSYPLLPNSAKSYLNIKGLLMYSNRVSYKKELDITNTNLFDDFQISDVSFIKHSNLTSVFDMEIFYKNEVHSNYNLDLRLQYDSISKLLANELQVNNIYHKAIVYRTISTRMPGDKYRFKNYKLLSSTDFKLYGRFYNLDDKTYPDESYFEIPFKVKRENQEIIQAGKSNWINVRYNLNENNQININSNGWVETKRYNLEPGEYNISFKAQGSLLDGEYSTIRIRDSYLNEIAIIELDGTNRDYSIPYKVSEKEEGISFILELTNFERKDDKDRRVLLEDWVRIE